MLLFPLFILILNVSQNKAKAAAALTTTTMKTTTKNPLVQTTTTSWCPSSVSTYLAECEI